MEGYARTSEGATSGDAAPTVETLVESTAAAAALDATTPADSTTATAPSRTAAWRREGTWISPGYRSARTRALWACGLLALSGAVSAFGAAVVASGIGLIGRYAEGTVSRSDLARFDDLNTAVSQLFLLLTIPTGIAFLAWLSRSVENAPPLWAGTPRTSPRGSIVWWFVPVASFVMPFLVARDLHDRYEFEGAASRRGLVVAWWLPYVAGLLASRVSVFVLSSTLHDAANLTRGDITGRWDAAVALEAGSFVLLVVSAVAGLFMIREIQEHANLRAARLGLIGPPPVDSGAVSDPRLSGRPGSSA